MDSDLYPTWRAFLADFLVRGGLIEGHPPSPSVTAVTVDLFIDPRGDVAVISTQDQVNSQLLAQFHSVTKISRNCLKTYRIVLIFRGSLISRISRIWNRSRNLFNENLSHCAVTPMGNTNPRNLFNEFFQNSYSRKFRPAKYKRYTVNPLPYGIVFRMSNCPMGHQLLYCSSLSYCMYVDLWRAVCCVGSVSSPDVCTS